MVPYCGYDSCFLKLFRNFGLQNALLSGLKNANGKYILTIDCDLQDPPDLINKMIDCYEQGYEVVHTRRTKRDGENFFKMLMTKFAYKIINTFSNSLENAGADIVRVSCPDEGSTKSLKEIV